MTDPKATGESNPFGDMPPEDFRAHGYHVVDWIADYLAGIDDYPVLAQVDPGEVRASLSAEVPEAGDPFSDVLRDFEEKVVPGVTHWNHPSFHAYFANTGSGPGILGEMLTAALNINAMVWRSSPAGTELEEHTLDWVRAMVGLPDEFEGVINDTASSSSLYALAAAREARMPGVREKGLSGEPAGRVYASAEAHSSIDKAGITLGFGLEGVRRIETDDLFRMKPEALRAAIVADIEAGLRPVAIVATVGTTSTTSIDPLPEIADVAEEFGLWLHVDAAYAGSAAITEELRPLFEGWERADSVVMNPHKWLFTPVDCSILFCRRPELLRRAFSLTPEYLRTSEQEVAKNLMDYGIPLGRRFRALKLWFVIRYFGREGIARRIMEHCRLAGLVGGWIEGEGGFEIAAPILFSTIVFRFAPEGVPLETQDEWNMTILDRVNETGDAFLSHTRLNGKTWIRLSIGNLRTQEGHLARTWAQIAGAASALKAEV